MNYKITLSLVLLLCNSFGVANAQPSRSAPRTVTLSRVRGWEAKLVQGNPNLARYYWEPMVRRTINTTATTGHQANKLPLPQVKRKHENVHYIESNLSRVVAGKIAPSDAHEQRSNTLVYSSSTVPSDGTASFGLGVNAQLANAKSLTPTLPQSALVAHQLSLCDDAGK